MRNYQQFLRKIIFTNILISLSILGTHLNGGEIKKQLRTDHKQFYAKKNLYLGAGLLTLGAILAHSPIDRDVQNWYQSEVRTSRSDNFAAFVKPFGSGRQVLPVYLTAAAFGHFLPKGCLLQPVAHWAKLSLRTIIIGAPPVVALQRILGASRPSERNAHWHPFKDDNTVSGHAFMGAVPFLSAAKMAQSAIIKSGLYLASTFTAWSRLNDNKHYLSQILMGWSIACLASQSIDMRHDQKAAIYFDFKKQFASAQLVIRF